MATIKQLFGLVVGLGFCLGSLSAAEPQVVEKSQAVQELETHLAALATIPGVTFKDGALSIYEQHSVWPAVGSAILGAACTAGAITGFVNSRYTEHYVASSLVLALGAGCFWAMGNTLDLYKKPPLAAVFNAHGILRNGHHAHWRDIESCDVINNTVHNYNGRYVSTYVKVYGKFGAEVFSIPARNLPITARQFKSLVEHFKKLSEQPK